VGVIETCQEVVICGVIETCPLPCFRIHGVAMFWGIEASTMVPIENLTMEKNKQNLGRT